MSELFTLKNNKHLLIRPVQASDYQAVQTYLAQLATETIFTNTYVGKPAPSPEDFQKKLSGIWMLGAFDGDTVVGIISANPLHNNDHPWYTHICEYGIHMLNAYRGNGLGNHFMGLLERWARDNHIHRIQGEVRQENKAGLMLYLKHGFVIEGFKHDCAYINGKWHNSYVIGRILD